jgi:hypothetical protein
VDDRPAKSDVRRDHPRSTLYFYVIGDAVEGDRTGMEDLIVELGRARDWVLGPPQIIDSSEDETEVIGGSLEIYSALPPYGADLPDEVDRRHFEEVRAIADRLSEFSKVHGLEIEFQLDDTYVGRITGGVPDSSLQVGLLDEWERILRTRESN